MRHGVVAVCLCAAAGTVYATPPTDQWKVVVNAQTKDGYLTFGNGQGQWLDTRCMVQLRQAEVPVREVPKKDTDALIQIYGISSCERIAGLIGGSAGQPWKVVTTGGEGGFVLMGKNQRQWLDDSCIARLRKANVTVSAVNWKDVKGFTQVPGVGDCDQVLARGGK